MSEVESPLLPQALDAEEALLGSILIDPEALLIAKPLPQASAFCGRPARAWHHRLLQAR